MKFAIIDGERHEAQPGLDGMCPACGKPMLAKCGQLRVWHWAHRGTRTCDPWWEPETEWHRVWKNHFPQTWQEIIHKSETGETHIADVKTAHGKVLEFQHSFLKPEERAAREGFYQEMAWVVDGRRRLRDRAQLTTAMRDGIVVCRKPLIVSAFCNESALMRDWKAARAPVYFDVGDLEQGVAPATEGGTLWRFAPGASGWAYLSPIPTVQFVHAHIEGLALDEAFRTAFERMATAAQMRQAPQHGPPAGFQRYLAARQRARRRF